MTSTTNWSVSTTGFNASTPNGFWVCGKPLSSRPPGARMSITIETTTAAAQAYTTQRHRRLNRWPSGYTSNRNTPVIATGGAHVHWPSEATAAAAGSPGWMRRP